MIDAVPGMSQSAVGNYAMVLGQTIRTLLLARLLGPASFGVLSMANVAANSTMYAELGTSFVADQKASSARGRGDEPAARAALRESAGARLAPALLLALGLLVAAPIAYGLGAHRAGAVLLFLAASAPIQAVWFSCRGYLRVLGEFSLATRAQLVQAALWLSVVPLAAWWWGLPGALAAIVISFVPAILTCLTIVPWRVVLRPDPRAFLRLVPAGIHLWLALVASFLFVYIDQFLVGSLLSTAAVGMYAIASVTSSVLLAFSDGAAAAAHPQTLEAHARDGGISLTTRSITRTIRTSQLVLGLLTPLSWFGLAVLVVVFLPAYAPALDVVVLLGPSAVAIALTTAANSALLAVGRHRRVPYFFLAALVVKVVAALLLLSWRPDLTTFAAATLIAALFFLVVYYRELGHALGLRGSRCLRWIVLHLSTPLLLAALGMSILLLEPRGPTSMALLSLAAWIASALTHAVIFRRHPGRLA